jgi:hypothetical protein
MNDLIEQANRALGRIDGVALLLPDISLFLYFYVRKEAVLSSQIEGTASSLSDLLLFENNEVPSVPIDLARARSLPRADMACLFAPDKPDLYVVLKSLIG